MSETATFELQRLSKDLKLASQTMSEEEVRYLVDCYYQLQEARKASGNQLSAASKSGEPHAVLTWFRDNALYLESQVQRSLDSYADSKRVGRWAKSIFGIGPVIAAGLLAHINIEKAPTAGHIWSFAGITPDVVWKEGEKRPFNATLKTLTWKIGQSFLKFSNNEECVYGQALRERWEYEKKKNWSGQLAGQAREKLAKFKIDTKKAAYRWYAGEIQPALALSFIEKGVPFSVGTTRTIPTAAELREIKNGGGGKTLDRYRSYMEQAGYPNSNEYPVDAPTMPMLPPAHILQRACRWTTKLFLAHWQHVAWEVKYGVPPVRPYIIEHGGHMHFIKPPNWPCD